MGGKLHYIFCKQYLEYNLVTSSLDSGLLTEPILSKYQIIEYTKTGNGCFPVINVCEFQKNNQYYEDLINVNDSIILMGGSQSLDTINLDDLYKTINLFIENNNKIIFLGYFPKPGINEELYYKKK